MSRRAKGARLFLREERTDKNGITRAGVWLILDGTRQISTGLGKGASEAEKDGALSAYLADKLAKNHLAETTNGSRDPSRIEIADVLAKYMRDNHIPYETDLRFTALERYWCGKKLSEVTGDTCREYVSIRREQIRQKRYDAAVARGTKKPKIEVADGGPRRELEDLRAAINHHRREGLHDKIVSVVMPAKGKRRERWLTRSEAAHLILTTWRYREVQNFRGTDRRTRRHVARFMVVARYLGSRASVICQASIEPRRPKGYPWIDLANGVLYGLPEQSRATKKRRQTLRIPPPLLAHLRRWRARGQRYVVEWNGEPIKRVSKAHAAAVATAGLDTDVTPHTWRHSLATWLMQAGADTGDAAQYLGMTEETLLRVYRHHRPDHSASIHGALRKKAA